MFEYKKTEEDFKYTKKFKDLELKNNLFKTKNKSNQERNKKTVLTIWQ